MWHVRRGRTRLRCVASLTDGTAGGTSRGETAASALHGVDVAGVLARTLLPGVTMGRTDTTGWRAPLVKARPWEVKGLDLVSTALGLGGTGALGGSNATGASYHALIHAGWCCGMSKEAARVSGSWPPSRTAPPAAPGGGKLTRQVYASGPSVNDPLPLHSPDELSYPRPHPHPHCR